MKDAEVKTRIYNFYNGSAELQKDQSLSVWVNGGATIRGKDEILSSRDNYGALDELGNGQMAHGTNNNIEYPEGEALRIHNEKHSELFQKLTDLELETLYFQNKCGFNGDRYEEFVIPPTAYRLGYYMSHIKNFCKKTSSKHLVLEIGGGWGGLCNLTLNNVENVNYVIVDIPTTIATMTYHLHKCGKKVCLPNEY